MSEVRSGGDLPSTHKHTNTPTESGTQGGQVQRQSALVYTTGSDKRSQPAYNTSKPNIPDSVVTLDSAAYVRTTEKDFLAGLFFRHVLISCN